MTIPKTKEKIIEEIKKRTGNAPDVTYKNYPIGDKIITLIYSNSVSSQNDINDFILRRLDEEGNKLLDKDIFSYVKNYIPNNTAILISTIKDALYYLFNGFTLFLFDDEKKIIAFENKANLTSSVQRSENEKSLKGPLDAFTENYQSNIGMIRRRLKTEDLWIKEVTVGEKSKTKVALFYLNGVCDKKLVDKMEHINIDDTLIDGNSIEDIGDLVLKDREVLSENGIVLVSATLSKKDKKILVGPEITTRGFIYVKDSKEMIDEIKKISLEVIENNTTDKYIDFNNIKNDIRERLGKYFYVETECKPMIIAVIQEI